MHLGNLESKKIKDQYKGVYVLYVSMCLVYVS